MEPLVCILCSVTSVACAVLLARQFAAKRGALLFWSTCCFGCLAVTNVLLFIDLILLPGFDMSLARTALNLMGMMMLLYGLIREAA